jgi:transcriptional regulator with XRE-family HTH domain
MRARAAGTPRAPKAIDIFVGSRIRLLRMQRKMSQGSLGKMLGLTYQQIQKYENGTNRLGASRLNDVANALNVSVSDLFSGAKDAEHKSFTAPQVAVDPQAFRIAEAFVKISDKEIRKLLIRFVETIARSSQRPKCAAAKGRLIRSPHRRLRAATAGTPKQDLIRVLRGASGAPLRATPGVLSSQSFTAKTMIRGVNHIGPQGW